MSSGPAKVRRRFTAGIRPGHYQYIMTLAQLATFKIFFEDTCEGGALTWTMTHPVLGGTATFRFVTEPTFAAIKTKTARVVVSFDYEVLP
jgi:hypothetical protein